MNRDEQLKQYDELMDLFFDLEQHIKSVLARSEAFKEDIRQYDSALLYNAYKDSGGHIQAYSNKGKPDLRSLMDKFYSDIIDEELDRRQQAGQS